MIYRFAEFEIDRAAYRLTRQGEAVRLEPRVFDLLVYLLEHRSRVIAKDELFAEVWQGQAVTDSVLTRAVYELRSALGDDSKQPRYLATVHGRGYRFVGEVREGVGDANPSPTPEADETPPPARPEALPSSRPSGRPRWTLWAGIGALSLLVGLAAAQLLRDPGTATSRADSAPEPERDRTTRLALLPFTTTTDDANRDLLSLSMTDLLWARLSAQPGLHVPMPDYGGGRELSSESIAAYLRDLGAEAAVTGRLAPIGAEPRARLTVELYRVDPQRGVQTLTLGGYDLPHLEDDADLAFFTRVREAIAANVIEQLGGAFSFTTGDGSSPSDPEAFRLYLEARSRLLDLTCGDREWVVNLLDRSIERDPNFGLAWLALGFAHYSQLWSCGREAEFALQALAAAERALEVSPEMSHALFLQTCVLTDLGRTEEAWQRLQGSSVRRSPQTLVARAYVLRHAGLLDLAANHVRDALELDPLVFEELGEVPLTLLYRGEYDTFLAYLPGLDSPYNLFYRGLTERLRNRPQVARELLEPAFRLNPNDLFARYSSSLLALLEGDRDAAGDIVRQVVHQRRTLAAAGGELTFKEAQLLAAAGDQRGAVEQLELAVDQGFFCSPCMASDPLLTNLTGNDAFRLAVQRAEERRARFVEATGAGSSLIPAP
ncbi:MAG: winged helix-turn-helix domain-containing protein [Acidobacteriota bacterium]